MRIQIQVVAFDCDGVMFDSREANAAYYNRVLAQFSRPPLTEDQLAFTHMNTVDASLRFLFPDEEEYQAAHAFRRTLTYLPFVPYMRIEPHLKPLLRRLRPACKTAVATNRTDTMHRVLEEHELTRAFDLVVGALDVPRPKPHPDSLLKIADHFAVPPEAMIFIGDSTLDAEASAAAGVPFIAYQNRELPAIHYIDALDQVVAIVERSGVRLPD
jgi:HAD superfamily hydrolase (TIGR01509 family)